jgi:hypothetical protein
MATRLKGSSSPFSALGSRALLVRTGQTSTTFVQKTVSPDGEQRFWTSPTEVNAEFWSERMSGDTTISGAIIFAVSIGQGSPAMTGTLRVRLYKITHGGSDIKTLIVQADDNVFLGAAGQYTLTATPPAAVTLVRGERFVWDVSIVAHPTTGFNSATATTVKTSAISDVSGSYIEFTETFTPLDDVVKLWLRRTNVAAIGNFFDMLTTQGASAATTGVVTTTAGGTEIPWTRTAGGTALEWVSGRVKEPFSINDAAALSGVIYVQESGNGVNGTPRVKVFHRAADGTETLVETMTRSTEIPTSATQVTLDAIAGVTKVLNQAIEFREDDRIVFRLYATNVGTMGAGTMTTTYDLNAPTGTGANYLGVYGAFTFKAEGDPAYVPSPGGMLGGVG